MNNTVAISTIGCNLSVQGYADNLYEENLFKNFECMADEMIKPQDLLTIVDICLQPPCNKAHLNDGLSSINENERCKSILYTEQKVQSAIKNKCSHIIVWPGCLQNYTWEDHQKLYSSTKERIEEIKSIYTQKATPYLEKLCRSLFTLCKKFPDIKFSIPSPRAFYEVPLFPQQLQWIFEDINCSNLGYWHNTSSCHNLEKIRLCNHEEWLEIHGHRIFGVHLEDTSNYDNLFPLGTGEVNFNMVKNYLPQNCIKVLRIAENFGLKGIKIALEYAIH